MSPCQCFKAHHRLLPSFQSMGIIVHIQTIEFIHKVIHTNVFIQSEGILRARRGAFIQPQFHPQGLPSYNVLISLILK